MPDHSRHPARHRGCGTWMLDAATNRHNCAACGAACGCSTCKAARPALLEVPSRCVVLGVDAARRSGWSVWYHPEVWRSSVGLHATLDWSGDAAARKLCEVAPAVKHALGLADRFGLPAVMVIEASPFAGRTAATAHGQGRAVGQWIMAWLAGGGKASRIVEYQPQHWRRDLWGESPPSDEARAREVRESTAIKVRCEGSPLRGCAVPGPDEAPAILIGKVGMHSPQVNAVLPRKFRQAVAGGEGRAA